MTTASGRRTSRRSSTGRADRSWAPGAGRGRSLHLDCFSGAAGNMLLGALFDCGVPQKVVRDALAALDLPGVRMRVEAVKRGALAARYVRFRGPERDATERRFATIRDLLERSELGPEVRERSLRVFTRLAEAEGRIHGIAPERVHFHEVGGVDAIGDVVGVCAAVTHLGVDRITASEIPLGHGTVDTAHGRLPLPAPATLELLRGVPTRPYDVPWETITPTGAALLAGLVDAWGAMDAGVVQAQGWGAGNDRKGPLPNALRAVLVERASALGRDRVCVIETHLDDQGGESLAFLLERLMDDGALDAALMPLLMKKGRPGHALRVVAKPEDRDRLARRILLESSTLGVRFSETPRLVLERRTLRVATRYGRIAVKLAIDPAGAVCASAEYDACARAARRHDVPLREVCREAERVALEEQA